MILKESGEICMGGFAGRKGRGKREMSNTY